MIKLTNSTIKYEMVMTSEILRGGNGTQNPGTLKTSHDRIAELIISSMFVARNRGRRASTQYYIKTYMKVNFIITLEHGKLTLLPTMSQTKFSR
jgi:hypothetical protein